MVRSDDRGMASKPLVSVIIPTYNRARYISETIESVLGQTYPGIEIIVIDDGSTDGTRIIVEKFSNSVQYVWQENSERGASRNHGLRLATGEFISFLDSDDLWIPDKVEEDVKYFQDNPNVGVIFTDAIQINADGEPNKLLKARSNTGLVTDKILENNFVLMATHMVRTELVRSIGGFLEERELSGSEDWEMWVRLSTKTSFAYRPKATAKIRTHDENSMGNAAGMDRSMNYAVDVMERSDYLTAEQKKRLNLVRSKVALVNAINYSSAGNRPRAVTELKNAARLAPSIILDARFGYTVLRLLTGNRISKLRRLMRS
ncbi:MAG: glycosyltransferase family 2 protein [Pyrinomonadaceae bacterium]|nr:glycosyltransferase family 2 protein [Pyrinomonadaceae bacterium]